MRAGCVYELSYRCGVSCDRLWFGAAGSAVQAFLKGRGEGLKLYPDPVRAGPTYNGPLDQNWDLCFGEIEQKIHLHSRGGSKGAFKPTAFAR